MSGILNKFRRSGSYNNGAYVAGQPGYNTVNSYSNGVSTQQVNSVEAPIIQQRVNAPIIQETVRNDRVVEVQPVIHRSVDHNVVHHIEKHITEASAPAMGGTYQRNPLVTQTVHTNVVNEIQPVIHRERVVPVAERVEQHHMQRVVEPTVHTHEVIYETVNSTVPTYGRSYGTAAAPGVGYAGNSGPTATRSTKHGLFHRH